MKQAALTLCVVLVMATLVDAACYKCINSKGAAIFTDTPPQDARCEWMAHCSSSYSEALERDNEDRDALLRSQWAEEEARKSELKQQELDAKRLALQQKELELRQRELDAMAEQARIDNTEEVYSSVIGYGRKIRKNHDARHPMPIEAEMKHKEPGPRARKDITQKKHTAGQAGSPSTSKNTNQKHPDKVQQTTPSQPSPIIRQMK